MDPGGGFDVAGRGGVRGPQFSGVGSWVGVHVPLTEMGSKETLVVKGETPSLLVTSSILVRLDLKALREAQVQITKGHLHISKFLPQVQSSPQ